MVRLYIAGDTTLDQYVYVTRPSQAPESREAWTHADRILSFEISGAAGGAFAALLAIAPELENDVRLCCELPRPHRPRSLFLLKEDSARWSIGTSYLTGQKAAREALEKALESLGPCPDHPNPFEKGTPLVILDYEQGWLMRHREHLPGWLKDRPALLRTSDPSGEEWQTFRDRFQRKFRKPGEWTWFSPLQDLAGGSLRSPGTWKDVRERAVTHLSRDATLRDPKTGRWKQNIIIQVQQDGVLLLPRGGDRNGELYIVAQAQPGSLAREGFGNVSGSGVVSVASLALPLAEGRAHTLEVLRQAIQDSLRRVQLLYRRGHRPPPDPSEPTPEHLLCKGLSLKDPEEFRDEVVLYAPPRPDLATARNIVAGNGSTFRRSTVLRLGTLVTADEDYASTLLGLYSRLQNHLQGGRKVLSLAVFGGPGSGKSMVAKQLARLLDPRGHRFEIIEHNLSQFDSPERLTAALRGVEKVGHKGKVPLVLWDEFDGSLDGQPRGWLSHFLMPMQDAEFFDGAETRKLPEKSVFFFIGGTFANGAAFKEWAFEEEGKALKGRDFHSRLDRSLDIANLDLAQGSDKAPPPGDPDPARLRRAILLRHWFRNDYPRVKRIDSRVFEWLLHVPLAHGARSLEGVLKASELGMTENFQPQHLPSKEMLALHLGGKLSPEEHLERIKKQPRGGRATEIVFEFDELPS